MRRNRSRPHYTSVGRLVGTIALAVPTRVTRFREESRLVGSRGRREQEGTGSRRESCFVRAPTARLTAARGTASSRPGACRGRAQVVAARGIDPRSLTTDPLVVGAVGIVTRRSREADEGSGRAAADHATCLDRHRARAGHDSRSRDARHNRRSPARPSAYPRILPLPAPSRATLEASIRCERVDSPRGSGTRT
jgi:hypothetical protein